MDDLFNSKSERTSKKWLEIMRRKSFLAVFPEGQKNDHRGRKIKCSISPRRSAGHVSGPPSRLFFCSLKRSHEHHNHFLKCLKFLR